MPKEKSYYSDLFDSLGRDPVWLDQSFTESADNEQIWKDFTDYVTDNGYQLGSLLDDFERYTADGKWPAFYRLAAAEELHSWGDAYHGWFRCPGLKHPAVWEYLTPSDPSRWRTQAELEAAGEWPGSRSPDAEAATSPPSLATPRPALEWDENYKMYYLFDYETRSYKYTEDENADPADALAWMSHVEADRVRRTVHNVDGGILSDPAPDPNRPGWWYRYNRATGNYEWAQSRSDDVWLSESEFDVYNARRQGRHSSMQGEAQISPDNSYLRFVFVFDEEEIVKIPGAKQLVVANGMLAGMGLSEIGVPWLRKAEKRRNKTNLGDRMDVEDGVNSLDIDLGVGYGQLGSEGYSKGVGFLFMLGLWFGGLSEHNRAVISKLRAGRKINWVRSGRVTVMSPNDYRHDFTGVLHYCATHTEGWEFDEGTIEMRRVRGRITSSLAIDIRGSGDLSNIVSMARDAFPKVKVNQP